MNSSDISIPIEPELIGAWVRARSIVRGLPEPVLDHGGWRVDTDLPQELRRHIFARADEGLRVLANAIDAPGIMLKLCGSEEEMRPLLPPRWQFHAAGYVMTGVAFRPDALPLAPGYSLQLTRSGVVTTARILSEDGHLAASAHAAELDDIFIYDRVVTAAGHQRRGLGTGLMRALQSTRKSASSIQILVATAQGRALYSSLGWRVRSPFTTAHIERGSGP